MIQRRIHRTRVYVASNGFADVFPLDYAFAGARINYDATAAGCAPGTRACIWPEQMDAMRLAVSSSFDVTGEQDDMDSGSIHFEFATRNDFGSINDVKSILDGIAYSSGIQLRASMARFISNPRRDGAPQPPVNTPGADPRYTTVPPGGVDTTKPGDALSTAGAFWFPQLDAIAKSLNIDSNTVLILAGIGVFILVKR